MRGHAFSSEDGRWRTDSDELTPGAKFVVEAAATGYGRVIRSLEAVVAPAPDDHVFALPPGQVVRGRVLTAAGGLPVRGARVIPFSKFDPIRRWSARNIETRLTATTGEDGSFVLEDAPLGEISLSVQHPDYPDHIDGPFTIVDGIPTARTILVATSARVKGTVVDVAGQPVPGVTISLRLPEDPANFRATAKSDQDGGFTFATGLRPGRYRLQREHDAKDTAPFTVASLAFDLAAGEAKEVRLTPPGRCTIRGTLRTADGSALPHGVTVFVTQRKPVLVYFTCRAVGGRFEMRGLPAGDFELRASAWNTGNSWSSPPENVRAAPGEPVAVAVELRSGN
jgi:hypothetical protein